MVALEKTRRASLPTVEISLYRKSNTVSALCCCKTGTKLTAPTSVIKLFDRSSLVREGHCKSFREKFNAPSSVMRLCFRITSFNAVQDGIISEMRKVAPLSKSFHSRFSTLMVCA